MDPYVGEIRMFAGSFAPRGWALCDGQLLSVNANQALFSLLGTIYGGDGRNTFGLPDLRGRVPIHVGTGPSLSPRAMGSKAGQETVTLTAAQLPAHSHVAQASSTTGNVAAVSGNVAARATSVDFYIDETPSVAMDASAIGSTGGNGAHPNLAPYLCVNFIIALVGIYPSRP